MKNYQILVLLSLVFSLKVNGQEVINFKDTLNFHIIERQDTVHVKNSVQNPYPSSLEVDLDCDDLKDIKLSCVTIPITNFPPAHEINIQNLAGSKLEFLNNNWLLKAFRMNDRIIVDSISGWEFESIFKLSYFFVLSGPHWAGLSLTDSLSVNNMYIVFRKIENSQYKYGWIKYSGKSWPAKLIIQEIAFNKSSCNFTNETWQLNSETKIKIYPNPVRDILYLKSEEIWSKAEIYDISGRIMRSKSLNGLSMDVSALESGTYFIRLKHGEKVGLVKFVKI